MLNNDRILLVIFFIIKLFIFAKRGRKYIVRAEIKMIKINVIKLISLLSIS